MVAHACHLGYPGVYSWETTRALDVDQPGQHSEMISQREEKATDPKYWCSISLDALLSLQDNGYVGGPWMLS